MILLSHQPFVFLIHISNYIITCINIYLTLYKLSIISFILYQQTYVSGQSSTVVKVYCENKTILLLGWSHRYKIFTVITIWLTVTKFPSLKWQWILLFWTDNCFHLSQIKRLPDFTIWRRVSDRTQKLMTLCDQLVSPTVFWWNPCCSSFKYSMSCCVFCLFVFANVVVASVSGLFNHDCHFGFL